ncbi:cob(I)yrinic acid a,c-diamide adenosyltransferase [Abyssisolibacter fermentans]|uniref:cob(I)yrinic acid a,c-diamide adenosyltransferase n=1 Tax=Abyssisolibacter fermentans TaxID=1766203 RepID=UPI000837189F|nr:cob(I)yrinic acid a,c-diamide adenosyltransferase [Abyssisolibacter fermentans]
MNKGYVHVYTGNGKGKTTAAFGLALRAVCAGKKVFVGQFVKGMKYSETKVEKYISSIEIKQFGLDCFIYKEPTQEDIDMAKKGLGICRKKLQEDYDVVILDEINIALYFKLVSIDEVLELINSRKKNIELILTGRYAPKEIIEAADLVTEMKEIKHYYNIGVEARKGIES